MYLYMDMRALPECVAGENRCEIKGGSQEMAVITVQ